MHQTLIHWLMILFISLQYCLNDVMGLLVVDSMEIVPCERSIICNNGMNLRIVLNASAIEDPAGFGSIQGVITSGQQWTDSFGDWELTQRLDLVFDYTNATWEYQLLDKGNFPLWYEEECYVDNSSSFGTLCDGTQAPCWKSYGSRNVTLKLLNAGSRKKFAIQAVEKWNADISIQSSGLNIIWNANYLQSDSYYANANIHLDAIFDTTTCYQDLENLYYVVPDYVDDEFYFTSQEYWKSDDVNNFNFTRETWLANFDCNYEWQGWHIIIPFFGDNDWAYKALAGATGTENPRPSWSNNQLWMWESSYIHRFFYQIMADCIDKTEYVDPENYRQGEPVDNLWKVTHSGIVDHFRITLDLDETFYATTTTKPPTSSPSNKPTQKVPTTKSPTSLSPTQSPTSDPSIPPTRTPSNTPTAWLDNLWQYYETPGKLEITSTRVIDVSSSTVSENIIEALALSLDIDQIYIRLDFAEYMSSIARRRLQSNDQILILRFTIFATTKDEKIMFETNLEDDSATHTNIEYALSDKFPHIISVFVDNVMHECEEGTKYITIAGERRCGSICAVNHYYDIESSSCKEQVEFIPITIIERNYLARILYFVIGIITGIGTLGLGYGIYRYCINKLKSESEDKSKRTETKKRVQAIAHDADSDLTESDITESECSFD